MKFTLNFQIILFKQKLIYLFNLINFRFSEKRFKGVLGKRYIDPVDLYSKFSINHSEIFNFILFKVLVKVIEALATKYLLQIGKWIIKY